MIHPTPGRIVWYRPSPRDLEGCGAIEPPMAQYEDQPLAAMVAGVHGARCVNLDVSDFTGRHYQRHFVQLLQGDGQDVPVEGGKPYAEWMPYQKGQAEKNKDPSLAPMQTVEAQRGKVDAIARVCYEANRAYCQALGDNSFLPWEEAPEWQRVSNRMGVDLHMSGDFGPEASHMAWMQHKFDEGWVYGPVKDPEDKVHPCLVPFSDLPPAQQAKDFIFRAIVHALR